MTTSGGGASTRVVLTGATGYIGGHLLPALVAAGYEVHALAREPDRLPPGCVPHLVPRATRDMVDLLGDVRAEAVVHVASLLRGVHDVEDVVPLIEANVTFGAQLAEAATRAGTRLFVNAGTAWQHFESRDFSPVALYAATKQALEDILRYYAEVQGLHVVNLKLFDTYGPDDPRGKLLSLLADAAMTGEAARLTPGEQYIDLVHIDDVASAFERALEVGTERQWGDYAISSGQPLTIVQLVDVVSAVMGRPVPVVWGANPYRPREMMVPWDAGPPPPGWQPRTSLTDGLSRILRSP